MLLWPVGFVLHVTEIETFEMPTERQFLILLVNGVIGTMLSEAMWLWYGVQYYRCHQYCTHSTIISHSICRACFLTSSLVGTLAITLQIPMSMLFDVLVKGEHFPISFYVGSIPMFVSLIAVAALLQHDDTDPLLRFCKIIYRKVCHCRRPSVVRYVHSVGV